MRILILNHEYPPLEGGAGNATYHLSNELAGRGHRVWVLTLGYPGRRAVERQGRVVVVRMPFRRARPGPFTYWELLRFSVAIPVVLRRLARRLGVGAMHAFFGLPDGVLAWRVAKRLGLPCVISLRGSDVPGFREGGLPALAFPCLRPLLRASWRWPRSRIVANSEDLRSLALRSAPTAEIRVVPNGVDCRRFQPRATERAASDGVTLLTVGQLVPRKRNDLLIGMLPRLRRESGKDVRLVIVGRGILKDELAGLAASLGVSDFVDFLGHVPPPEMPRVYHEADAFLLASKQEGMPNAVLEALASGLPVVSTRVGGLADLISDGTDGYVVGLDDTEGAFQRALELVASPARRHELGRGARRRAEACSWASVAEQYEAIYGELLHPQSSSLKIAIVGLLTYPLFNPSCAGKFGGAEVQCRLVSEGLAADGHDVSVVTFDHGQPAEQWFGGVRVVKSMPPVTRGSPLRALAAQSRLYRTLCALEPDVVLQPNATGVVLTVALYALAHGKRSACLVTHDSAFTRAVVGWSLDRAGFAVGLRLCDGIIVRNRFQEGRAHRLRGSRARLIASVGTARRLPAELPAAGRDYVLWVGRCVDWKRPELFLDLAARLPDAAFLMVAPPQEQALFAEIEAGAKEVPNFRLVAGGSFEEMDDIYRKARFLVNTSVEEGFPTTFVEAASWGCPIVSLRVNPSGFLTASGGGVVCGDNFERLVEATGRLWHDEPHCREMGARARAHVKQHNDFQVVAREYEAAFRRLVM